MNPCLILVVFFSTAVNADDERTVRIGDRYLTCEQLLARTEDERRAERFMELRRASLKLQESAAQLTDAAEQLDDLATWTRRLDTAREALDMFSSIAGKVADMGTGFSITSSVALKILEEGYKVTGEDIECARQDALAGAQRFSSYADRAYQESIEVFDGMMRERTAYQNNCVSR